MKIGEWCLLAGVIVCTGMCAGATWSYDPAVPERWSISSDAKAIEWKVSADRRLPHADHLEMNGHRASVVLGYGVDADGALKLSPTLIAPGFRMMLRATSNQFVHVFSPSQVPSVTVGDHPVLERPELIRFDGTWTAISRAEGGLRVTRTVFPSMDQPWLCQLLEVVNEGTEPVSVGTSAGFIAQTEGVKGRYEYGAQIFPSGGRVLKPGERAEWGVRCYVKFAYDLDLAFDAAAELSARRRRLDALAEQVELVTDDPVLNLMYRFAKQRVGESVFFSDMGMIACPGCGKYYSAQWPNDQIEYVGTWFGITGDIEQQMSELNAARLFRRYMKDDFAKLPSCINSEGNYRWEPLERGDAAMYASGLSGFLLCSGRADWAREFIGALEWTLEFCRRRLTVDGVVASDCDELEMRYPAGKANLCTSALYYEALKRTAIIARELGDAERARDYAARAEAMAAAIERYFGCEKGGRKTYRYFDGCTETRAWISIASCVGLKGRERGVMEELFSPRMWNGAEMLSAEHDRVTVWDRTCLSAFRGLARAGLGDEMLPKIRAFSRNRLLGEHVPYAVELNTTRNGAHSAAEGALFCRIFTEGYFGLEPTGFGTFRTEGRLPKGLGKMELRNIRAFGRVFDLVAGDDGVAVRTR